MANQRGTFAKRNREMKLKDRAREKAERRNERRADPREQKGPEIAWDQAGGVGSVVRDNPDPAPVAGGVTAPPPPASGDGTDTDT